MTNPDSGSISEHNVLAVMWEGVDIGWLYWFGDPARYVFETPHPELRDLERIAWPQELEAVQQIRVFAYAYALEAVDEITARPPLCCIDSRFDALTILASEPVVVDGRELGCIHWDSLSRKCVFETPRPELRDLEGIAWSCPASALLHVMAFDRAAQEGMAASGSIQ